MTPAVYGVMFPSIALAIIFTARYLALGRTRQSKVALEAEKQFRGLTDEYRRLSDMAEVE
jgi:hypothetical protein